MLHSRTVFDTLSAIVAGTTPIASVRSASRRSAPSVEAPAPRDHALALHRFVGGVQMLGGLTLASAYALGADSVNTSLAAPILTALGVAQLVLGATWMLRARALRELVTTRPGSVAAVALAAATLVAALGGSGSETAWVTSAQCWLIAAGAILPLRGLLVAGLGATALASAVWIALDGPVGGYEGDGHYAIAIIALAKFLLAGLLLGSLTGGAWRLLTRWHVIEVHERGIVGELRGRLAAVDAAAVRLAAHIDADAASRELRALRERLARGIAPQRADGQLRLSVLLDDLAARRTMASASAPVSVHLASALADAHVDAITADTLAATIERQLDNIARHAPATAAITITAERAPNGAVRVEIVDDGGGEPPARPGTGTAWSERQLRRIGGHLAYFAAPRGVGLRIEVPAGGRGSAPLEPVRQGLDRFAFGMVAVLRWSSYIGDTLVAQSLPGIGDRWLLMPLGALLIELAIQRGVPGLATTRQAKQILASVLAVALTAAFTLPAGSPETLVPASTSVVVLAQLLLARQHGAWLLLEAARAAAVLPLVQRTGGSLIEIAVIYPVAFNLLVFGLRRFIDRAQHLERTVLDALGRTALATAAVRGLTLHHDAIDVLLRAAPDDPELRAAGADLERAVRELDRAAIEPHAPAEILRSGLEAALAVPVTLDAPPAPRRPGIALDRLALVELAALAADERASCAPPGLLGRRRLRGLHLHWTTAHDGTASAALAAEPTLTAPDRRSSRELRRIAGTLGIDVHAGPADLRLAGIAP